MAVSLVEVDSIVISNEPVVVSIDVGTVESGIDIAPASGNNKSVAARAALDRGITERDDEIISVADIYLPTAQ